MKLYLIAVLFIATLVVVPCLAEEEKQETTEQEKAEDADEQIPEEFRDEIQQQKRRRVFPQLSVYSCRILKKYGYCKYIKTFCRRICILQGCKINYYAVGCFMDAGRRPLPYELLNERDRSSKVFGNRFINWHDWDNYMVGFACRCAKKAAKKGYKVFGIQYYGECWSGPNPESYKAVGAAHYSRCVGKQYRPCTKLSSHCVGKANINFVYKIVR